MTQIGRCLVAIKYSFVINSQCANNYSVSSRYNDYCKIVHGELHFTEFERCLNPQVLLFIAWILRSMWSWIFRATMSEGLVSFIAWSAFSMSAISLCDDILHKMVSCVDVPNEVVGWQRVGAHCCFIIIWRDEIYGLLDSKY